MQADLEGSMFYWVYWWFWIFCTFILKRQNPYRLKLSVFILTMIILANFHFTLAMFDLYASGFFLLFLSYAVVYKEKTKTLVYYLICSFIVTLAYVTFRLFEIFDPVWIVFNKDWMMGICICYIAILLQKSLRGRLIVIASGTMQGEILYAYILSKFDFSYPIGTLAYLDVCALTSVLVVCWSCLENASFYFENYGNINQKGKQKTS